MRRSRLGLSVAAVVVGVGAAVLQNWWTAAGMACVLVGEGLAARARRRAATVSVAPTPGAAQPPGQ